MFVSNNPNRIIHSKAASSAEESIIEGIPHYTVNKVKVIQEFLSSNGEVNESRPMTVSKAASVISIDKVKAIHDFMKSNGRI